MTYVEVFPDPDAPDFTVRAQPPGAAEFAALADLASRPTDDEIARLVRLAEQPLEVDDEPDDDAEQESEDQEVASLPEESSSPLSFPDALRVHAGVPIESTQQRDARTNLRRGHTPPNLTAGMTIDFRRRKVLLTASGELVPGGWDIYLADEQRRAAKRRAVAASAVPSMPTELGSRAPTTVTTTVTTTVLPPGTT